MVIGNIGIIDDLILHPAGLGNDQAVETADKVRIDLLPLSQFGAPLLDLVHAIMKDYGDIVLFFVSGDVAADSIAMPEQGDDLFIDFIEGGTEFFQFIHFISLQITLDED